MMSSVLSELFQRVLKICLAGSCVILPVLMVGLCCNPGKESIAKEAAWELVLTEGGYAWNANSVWYETDCENDNKKELFIEVGEEQPDTDQLKGDLWFISEDGEATLLLEDKSFYKWEAFVSRGREFPLFSYKEEGGLKTAVFEVRENIARKVFYGQEEKYVDGENLVCFYPDKQLEYDIKEKTFLGYDEKKYICYYDGQNFSFYDGYNITREDVTNYKNGSEVLKSIEKKYPEASFEYIARKNNCLHINVAYREQDIIYFRYFTYDTTDGSLTLSEEGPGCYKRAINIEAGGTTFVQQIAKKFG